MTETKRTTYTEAHRYSAKVMRWRKAVMAPRDGMTNGCRVLLLRLSDDMNANGVVSVPRQTLADDLGVAPARITEGIKMARQLGFLDIVRRARQHVTATYSGTFPEVRQGVPLDDDSEVRQSRPLRGTPGRTPNKVSEVRPAPTPRSSTDRRNETAPDSDVRDELRNKERGCLQCGSPDCFHFACVDVAIASTDDQWRTA